MLNVRWTTFYFSTAILLSLQSNAQQPESPLVRSFAEHRRHQQSTPFGFEWIQLGPTSNSALVESFQVDLQHPGTIYSGFGSGGLWKTVNNGLSWKPIFDHEASYGIGDVALAPSNTNIIYLGTGETLKKPRNFTMPGTGMYRSDDGGDTWRHIGLSDSWHIAKVAVHPTDPDIVYAAVLGHLWTTNPHRGVFRSMDGGKSWEHTLYVNERTGANDIVLAPSDPNTVYASVWESYPGVNGSGSGIWKSTDAGKTWTATVNGLPVDGGKGRIGLAVSYTNPQKAYALLDHRNKPKVDGAQVGAAELYQTLDGGKNWNRTHTDELMIFDQIGWYFADVVVDPSNDEHVYSLGVRLAHSVDGGKSFSLVGGDVYHLFPNPAGPLHLDQCELWINPVNPDHLALANDGGFYVSHDRGATWMHYNNIPTGEFYDITLDHRTPYTIYAGAQDDATVYGPGNEWVPKRHDSWKYLWIDPWSGGDGCVTVIDPLDSNLVYWSSQEGWIRRMDLRTRKSVLATPSEQQMKDLRFNFISPYFLSSHTRSLYLGANRVMKSDDQGRTWTPASPDLTIGRDRSRNSLALGAIVESELKPGLLYAGTDKGLFWVSNDGGLTWTERTTGLPSAYIRSISPSKYNESRVYVALSGLNFDDQRTHLYRSEDQGKTWERISRDLPSEVAYVIKEDPRHENVLFAGLYRAVYVSLDRGNSWSQFGQGMPSAAVSDIEFEARSGDLVVATHGRGLYKINLTPFYTWIEAGKPDKDQVFPFGPVHGPNPDHLPDDQNSITVEKLPFTFWRSLADESTISLIDEAGKVVWSKSIKTRRGFNQYRWDFIIRQHISPLPYFTGAEEYLKRGNYSLQITGGVQRLETTLIIKD